MLDPHLLRALKALEEHGRYIQARELAKGLDCTPQNTHHLARKLVAMGYADCIDCTWNTGYAFRITNAGRKAIAPPGGAPERVVPSKRTPNSVFDLARTGTTIWSPR